MGTEIPADGKPSCDTGAAGGSHVSDAGLDAIRHRQVIDDSSKQPAAKPLGLVLRTDDRVRATLAAFSPPPASDCRGATRYTAIFAAYNLSPNL